MKTPDMFPPTAEAELRQLEEADLERRFGEYWQHVDYWDGTRLYRSVIACGKMLLEAAKDPSASSNRVGAIKAAGDMFLRLLNKHMPDLKAIEMSGNTGMSQEDALELLAAGVRAAEQTGAAISVVRGDVPPHSDEGGVH